MPTSPFASPTAAHRAAADGQLPASKRLAAVRAAWGSSLSPQSKQQVGSKQEQQCFAQAKANTAGDASQGQSEAALSQLPAAPLFVAQSPAGKGQADEWVKKYLAMHPTESEEEALRGAAMTLCPPSTQCSIHWSPPAIGFNCLF